MIPKHILDYLEQKGITPPVEKVVCAANRLPDGTIICGARHWDEVMRNVADKLTGERKHDAEQGFINQWGVFLSREEAMQVVLASGQPFDPNRNGSKDLLFSEGLY